MQVPFQRQEDNTCLYYATSTVLCDRVPNSQLWAFMKQRSWIIPRLQLEKMRPKEAKWQAQHQSQACEGTSRRIKWSQAWSVFLSQYKRNTNRRASPTIRRNTRSNPLLSVKPSLQLEDPGCGLTMSQVYWHSNGCQVSFWRLGTSVAVPMPGGAMGMSQLGSQLVHKAPLNLFLITRKQHCKHSP